jgi:ketosteroid isomerase-like protein
MMLAHPVGGGAMNSTAFALGNDLRHDSGYQEVLHVAAEEAAAIESGDAGKYIALLAPDAVFLPQNETIKAGEELRSWIREFLKLNLVHYLDFRHLETEVRDDVAYHAYVCRWTVSPNAGGPAAERSVKGLQILRRQADGAWKISVSISNDNPAPPGLCV